jgi:CrcB protein
VTPLLVAVGAALGATLRFWTSQRLDGAWPRGTLVVNTVGSFLLGLLVGAGVSADGLALLGTGFCGGLTTYSAFAVQTHDRGRLGGAMYATVTVINAVAACALGFVVGQA